MELDWYTRRYEKSKDILVGTVKSTVDESAPETFIFKRGGIQVRLCSEEVAMLISALREAMKATKHCPQCGLHVPARDRCPECSWGT